MDGVKGRDQEQPLGVWDTPERAAHPLLCDHNTSWKISKRVRSSGRGKNRGSKGSDPSCVPQKTWNRVVDWRSGCELKNHRPTHGWFAFAVKRRRKSLNNHLGLLNGGRTDTYRGQAQPRCDCCHSTREPTSTGRKLSGLVWATPKGDVEPRGIHRSEQGMFRHRIWETRKKQTVGADVASTDR